MTRRRHVTPKPRARRPVRRLVLYKLASVQKWDEVTKGLCALRYILIQCVTLPFAVRHMHHPTHRARLWLLQRTIRPASIAHTLDPCNASPQSRRQCIESAVTSRARSQCSFNPQAV